MTEPDNDSNPSGMVAGQPISQQGFSFPSVVVYDTLSEFHDRARKQLQDPGFALADWRAYEKTARRTASKSLNADAQFSGMGRESQTSAGTSESDPGGEWTPTGNAAADWARSRGLILEPGPLNASVTAADEIHGGMEHNVFHDKASGRMVKIAQDEFFGMHSPLDFDKYLER
ncbi:MAG: hypothetical protein KA250_06245 [Verrucomicrobiales bacterium]|jgi:hypothetical protein|nr:hypothetical protein [Verrucomicrobiales bacterium]MBP9223734.1 hypothetical protein [Verrucomicrobiales bacterium]